MVSALMSSQSALHTTAHNLTNVDTEGYVRQQVLLQDAAYQNIGQNAVSTFSVGLGTDIDSIRQVRDVFLDQSYREESGRMGFYDAQADAVHEIETILGEIEGESFSDILDDFWVSLNELQKYPDGLETRASFIQNSVLLVERANLIQQQINDYQQNMNAEATTMVSRINEIGQEIDHLNDVIARAEMNGGNANDYRDQRNLLLDELASYVDIRYREVSDGSVMVSVENVPFVIKGNYYPMATAQAEAHSDLEVPYWPHLGNNVFNLNNPIGPQFDNDVGRLKGLVAAMGSRKANYTDLQDQTVYENEVKGSVIMQAQAQFDNLIHGIVTMVNDMVSPNTSGDPAYLDTDAAPYGMEGSQGIEIFSRKYVDRYTPNIDSNTVVVTTADYYEYIQEDSGNDSTLYSAGNLEVNPDVLADYDLIALSVNNGYNGDSTVVQQMLNAWDDAFSALGPGATAQMNFREYYTAFIGEIGSIGSVAKAQVDNQELMALQIDNQRSELMGVSSDEELSNMMKYQHAYNAAARMVTVVDSMMEQIVTSLGIVGR